MVTILILAMMLVGGAAISIGAVQAVLSAFALFTALLLVLLTACMLPGYTRIRGRVLDQGLYPRVHRPARTARLSAKIPALR